MPIIAQSIISRAILLETKQNMVTVERLIMTTIAQSKISRAISLATLLTTAERLITATIAQSEISQAISSVTLHDMKAERLIMMV